MNNYVTWEDIYRDKCAELQAENDRLRAALQKIVSIEDDHWSGDWAEIEVAREIAHQALNGTRTEQKEPML